MHHMHVTGVLLLLLSAALVCAAAPDGTCACTYEYAPVCADDGKTYANESCMKCAGEHLTVARRGACEQQ